MKKSLITLVLALFASAVFSTVWNVNNISGIAADFNDLIVACNSSELCDYGTVPKLKVSFETVNISHFKEQSTIYDTSLYTWKWQKMDFWKVVRQPHYSSIGSKHCAFTARRWISTYFLYNQCSRTKKFEKVKNLYMFKLTRGLRAHRYHCIALRAFKFTS